MKELAVLNKFFYKYRWRFLLGIAFVIISNYFRILQPRFIRYALDLVIENVQLYNLYDGYTIQEQVFDQTGKILLLFGGLTIGFAIMMGLFMYLMRQTIIVMSRLIEYDMRKEIYDHYQKLTLAFYKKNNTGDLMARITEDVGKVRMYLGPAIMYSINLLASAIMIIYAMVQVSPMLSLYALIPLPILSISIYYINSRINRQSEAIQKQLSTINSLSQEVYSGIRVVKSYVQEDAMGNYFADECETYKDKSLSLAKTEAFFRPLMMLLIGASTIITIYVGGLLAIDGTISTGNIAEFIIYINMLTWPVASIGWVASIIQRAAASQKRINEFLNTTPDIIPDQTLPQDAIEGDIVFNNVSFTYPDTGIHALKNISFRLKKGQKIAITGRTGSGKTTIADLMLRLYDASEGDIFIDNKNITNHNLANLRDQIGYVPQDVFLFSETVEGNIKFAAENAPEDKVHQYAKYASVYHDIMSLENGFETMVGERGVTLSGGQKQRISIARALIKEPSIIIFDDCLSAVDTKTEAEISQYLQDYCADKTSVIITHRFYTSLSYDHIIVLDDGAIIEEGTHEELMAKNGYYAELYEKQRLEEVN